MTTSKRTNPKTSPDFDLYYGKLPPRAIEVEEAVLGALMLEPDAIYRVSGIISEETFYKNEHQIIFRSIIEVSESNKAIDLLTVTQSLKDKNLLEEIGGMATITQCTRRVAAAAHIEHHARIIADKHFARVLIHKFLNCITVAYQDNQDELLTEYNITVQTIDELLAGSSGMKHISVVLGETRTDLDIRHEKALSGEIQGVNTGLAEINNLNNGWQKGELIVIAARPSMGKTAVALNMITKSAALQGKNVCFFSLEMENIKLSKRLILSYGGINRHNFEKGAMTPGEWEAYNIADKELRRLPIYIDDTAGVSVRHITSVIRTRVRKNLCDLVVVDYLQLIESPDKEFNQTREREVAEISRGLKMAAKAAGVPIILLAQLNRQVENRPDKTPRLSDLRESGAIEQDADMVIFPWRPTFYDPSALSDSGDSLQNVMFFEIAKNRDGKIATIFCKHNEDLTQFGDYGPQYQHVFF